VRERFKLSFFRRSSIASAGTWASKEGRT
jgi:hypothetical protein